MFAAKRTQLLATAIWTITIKLVRKVCGQVVSSQSGQNLGCSGRVYGGA